MVLFLQGDEENLQRTELVVEDFCKDIGAKVNWDKTHADFNWVFDGLTLKYLGFTIEREIP